MRICFIEFEIWKTGQKINTAQSLFFKKKKINKIDIPLEKLTRKNKGENHIINERSAVPTDIM